MKSFGYPVILDVTHSLQQPNQTSGVTGGMPQLIETINKKENSEEINEYVKVLANKIYKASKLPLFIVCQLM